MNEPMSLEPFYRNVVRRKRHKRNVRDLGFVALGFVFCVLVSCFVTFCTPKPVQKVSLNTIKSHETTNLSLRQILMTNYFKENGNKHPEKMAAAVLATKKPKLMAAIAVKENTPYTVRHGGYKKRHAGAFQVSQKDWGFVPYDPVKQALQSERVLEELLEESDGNIKKALNAYGGDKTRKVYAQNILEEIAKVP